MKYSHIIWDFNGTIIDDVKATMQAENILFSRRNLPLFTDLNQFREAFMLPFTAFYEKLGIDFSVDNYADLSTEFMTEYISLSANSMMHDDALPAFKQLRDLGVAQVIISASEITVLNKQIDKFAIREYFDEILGLGDYQAISKAHLAKDWMDRIKPENPLFIGDTVHDYEVAQSVGIDCALIATGSQTKNVLSQYTKTYESIALCLADITK